MLRHIAYPYIIIIYIYSIPMFADCVWVDRQLLRFVNDLLSQRSKSAGKILAFKDKPAQISLKLPQDIFNPELMLMDLFVVVVKIQKI